MKAKNIIKSIVAGATILGGVELAKANDFLDIWNVTWDFGKGQESKVIENSPDVNYLRGPARELRIYGWGSTDNNLLPHEIKEFGINPNKAQRLTFRLEAETVPNGVSNEIYLNHWATSPLDVSKRNFFMIQSSSTPVPVEAREPNAVDLVDLTNGFTQNGSIPLPNITATTPRTPDHYDEWNLVISNYADIAPSVVNKLFPDGKVDVKDVRHMAPNWLRQDCGPENNWCDYSDINRDGKVNMKDLGNTSEQYLSDPNTISKAYETRMNQRKANNKAFARRSKKGRMAA